jgi:hypothetical protein
MKWFVLIASIALGLAACTQKPDDIRVTQSPAPAKPKPLQARTEPIFYNGKTYTLKFAPAGQGTYKVSVLGMTDAQQKDAVAVATSSIRYFTCPDGQTGKLTNQPRYAANAWTMSARCG